MRNLGDLNNHLFAQLERVGNEDLEGDALKHELERTKAVATLSREIINNARTVLAAEKEFGQTTRGNQILALENRK